MQADNLRQRLRKNLIYQLQRFEVQRYPYDSDASVFLEELGQGVDTLDLETFNAFLKNTYISTDFVPYILPAMYNYVFADTDPNAQNFVLDNSAEISVCREKSKVNVPNTI